MAYDGAKPIQNLVYDTGDKKWRPQPLVRVNANDEMAINLDDSTWGVNHVDDTTTTDVTYVGKEKNDGTYWIMKIDETGSPLTITHATITNNPTVTTYNAAWTARATTLTYNVYSTAFV